MHEDTNHAWVKNPFKVKINQWILISQYKKFTFIILDSTFQLTPSIFKRLLKYTFLVTNL